MKKSMKYRQPCPYFKFTCPLSNETVSKTNSLPSLYITQITDNQILNFLA